jgi:hypothetical protein
MALGRPKGSLNDKPWKEAIRKAVAARALDGGKAIDKLARSLVAQGLEGNISALTEIGNRLDGKASQPIEHSGHLDVAMTLDRVITEMRERELAMRSIPELVDDAVRH